MPYAVTEKDSVVVETNSNGDIKKVTVNGIKLKKSEYNYNAFSKLIKFSGNNLAGSWTVK